MSPPRFASRLRPGLALIALVVAVACTLGAAAQGDTTSVTLPASLPSDATTCAAAFPALRVVSVSNTAQLYAALAAAQPGQCIQLAAGRYVAASKTPFVLTAAGTEAAPLALVGPRGAVLTAERATRDPVLSLRGAAYWSLAGFDVEKGLRSVELLRASDNRLHNLRLYGSAKESVYLSDNSSRNVLTALEIRDVGVTKPSSGTAVRIGTAASDQLTSTSKDASNGNVLLYSRIGPNVAGASVYVNAYCTGGVIANNVFDGRGQSGRNSQTASVDMQGNGFLVRDNTLYLPLRDGFRVRDTAPGYGSYNVYAGNTIILKDELGLGHNTVVRASSIWRCDNFVRGGRLVSNLEKCGDAPLSLMKSGDKPLETQATWPEWQNVAMPTGKVPASTSTMAPIPPIDVTPTTSQPAPTQPAPTQPAPTQPAPTQPAPTQPAPTQPAPTQPAPTQPTPTPTPTTPTADPVVPPKPAPSPVAGAPASACASYPAKRVVSVYTASGLTAALAGAEPGDRIDLAPGIYLGHFKASARSGTETQPITVCGPREAIIDGGSYSAVGYAFWLADCSRWRLIGFTVRNAQKGVMLDRSTYNLLSGLLVYQVGMEAVHFRTNSQYNRLEISEIRQTGLAKADYGEGLYIGSAKSNLVGDKSDYNQVVSNRFGPGITAEAIDIKEYSTGGIILNNYFDGVGMSGANFADSWIDVKGNGYYIAKNHGVWALNDGFQTHTVVNGWGPYNVFDGNLLDVKNKGVGIWMAGNSVNLIRCNNQAPSAASGFSNLPAPGCSETPITAGRPSTATSPSWPQWSAAAMEEGGEEEPETPAPTPDLPDPAPFQSIADPLRDIPAVPPPSSDGLDSIVILQPDASVVTDSSQAGQDQPEQDALEQPNPLEAGGTGYEEGASGSGRRLATTIGAIVGSVAGLALITAAWWYARQRQAADAKSVVTHTASFEQSGAQPQPVIDLAAMNASPSPSPTPSPVEAESLIRFEPHARRHSAVSIDMQPTA